MYDGSTLDTSLYLTIDTPACGVEVTQALCTGDTSQCNSTTSSIPGSKKFVYSATVILPHTSAVWRFIYTGNNGSAPATLSCGFSGTYTPVGAGRAAAITNIAGAGGTIIQLIDTLNNTVSGNSNSYVVTATPTFFNVGQTDTYNPDSVDPDTDSLSFSLTAATNGVGACGAVGGPVSYTGTAWPGMPVSSTRPLTVTSGSMHFDSTSGALSFYPNVLQRSIVVYNIREYRGGVFVGSSQYEMTVLTRSDLPAPCTGIPDAGIINATYTCTTGSPSYLLSLTGIACGVTMQWQSSTNAISWANITGATTAIYLSHPIVPGYYRCVVTCVASGLAAYSTFAYLTLSSSSLLSASILAYDTSCNNINIFVNVCSTFPTYNITTYFGDGTSSNVPLTSISTAYANVPHTYAMAGCYTIKQVLYNGTVAVDSIIFPYEYIVCNTLPIRLYFDINANCIKDSTELYNSIPTLVRVDSNGIIIDTLSTTSGIYYKAYAPPGTIYSFSLISSGFYASCPISAILSDTILATVSNYPVKYFGLECSGTPSFDLTESSILACARHIARGQVLVRNLFCASENATVVVNFSPKYMYYNSPYNAYPPPSSYSATSITWDFSSVSSLLLPPPDISFRLDVPGTWLTVGDTVNSNYTVTPIAGDAIPGNNYCVRNDTVKGSWDPNYIGVIPSGCIPSDSVTQLQYAISFENTGNDTAFNIHIMDTLSANVDPHSLRIVSASAVMNISVFNDGINNITKFDFPQINLLDSNHFGLCDGMVVFTIKTREGLPDGTTIFNRAGIYFDDNDVVMTNTVENMIGCPGTTAVSSAQVAGSVDIFPNPAKDELTIKMTKGAYTSYTITNSIGQEMVQHPLALTQTKVNISKLPVGVYYVTFRGSNGTAVRKFVKL